MFGNSIGLTNINASTAGAIDSTVNASGQCEYKQQIRNKK